MSAPTLPSQVKPSLICGAYCEDKPELHSVYPKYEKLVHCYKVSFPVYALLSLSIGEGIWRFTAPSQEQT